MEMEKIAIKDIQQREPVLDEISVEQWKVPQI